MSYEYKFKKEMSEMNEYTPRETVAEINEFPFMAMPERKLTKETCERLTRKTICVIMHAYTEYSVCSTGRDSPCYTPSIQCMRAL